MSTATIHGTPGHTPRTIDLDARTINTLVGLVQATPTCGT